MIKFNWISIFPGKQNINSLVNFKEHKLDFYLKRAMAVSEQSHDPVTKVGTVLVNKENGATISEGYNGYVRGADDENLPKTRPEKYEFLIHAEENLIANAARNGIRTNNCVLICTLSPCTHCLRLCWQAGIDVIYFPEKSIYKDFESSLLMGDLKIRKTGKNDFIKLELSRVME